MKFFIFATILVFMSMAVFNTEAAYGNVKWYNDSKGFGFITPVEGGPDIFVHVSQIISPDKRLIEGQRVSFDIKESNKGKEAINVLSE